MAETLHGSEAVARACAYGATRRLIHIPVVHSLTGLDSIATDVRDLYVAQKGRDAWGQSRRMIADFWRDLERKIKALDLDCDKLRLYQDGLPVCGREAEIICDLVETGGLNYRILLFLMARGAKLEGTESPELLLKEYRLRKTETARLRDETCETPRTAAAATAGALLKQRDRFIARRIDATLRPGETGMLFVGGLHRVVDMLPRTIDVKMLDDIIQVRRLKRAGLSSWPIV